MKMLGVKFPARWGGLSMDEHQRFIIEHEALCRRICAEFEGQPFPNIMIALIRLLVEVVEAQFGKVASRSFENDMREAYRKVVRQNTN
jgi:hypothetical protein